MGFEYGGIIGIVIFALDIWAIVRLLQSGASTGAKVLWLIVILALPVVGLLIWLLAGPK
jgi:Phospholipase_D-nuclease N-terminal